jgi:hypothetical protein
VVRHGPFGAIRPPPGLRVAIAVVRLRAMERARDAGMRRRWGARAAASAVPTIVHRAAL